MTMAHLAAISIDYPDVRGGRTISRSRAGSAPPARHRNFFLVNGCASNARMTVYPCLNGMGAYCLGNRWKPGWRKQARFAEARTVRAGGADSRRNRRDIRLPMTEGIQWIANKPCAPPACCG
jgi:hypothetical protein